MHQQSHFQSQPLIFLKVCVQRQHTHTLTFMHIKMWCTAETIRELPPVLLTVERFYYSPYHLVITQGHGDYDVPDSLCNLAWASYNPLDLLASLYRPLMELSLPLITPHIITSIHYCLILFIISFFRVLLFLLLSS